MDLKEHSQKQMQRELEALKAKLDAAEQARLAGASAYTLEESRARLEAIFNEKA